MDNSIDNKPPLYHHQHIPFQFLRFHNYIPNPQHNRYNLLRRKNNSRNNILPLSHHLHIRQEFRLPDTRFVLGKFLGQFPDKYLQVQYEKKHNDIAHRFAEQYFEAGFGLFYLLFQQQKLLLAHLEHHL